MYTHCIYHICYRQIKTQVLTTDLLLSGMILQVCLVGQCDKHVLKSYETIVLVGIRCKLPGRRFHVNCIGQRIERIYRHSTMTYKVVPTNFKSIFNPYDYSCNYIHHKPQLYNSFKPIYPSVIKHGHRKSTLIFSGSWGLVPGLRFRPPRLLPRQGNQA